MRTCWRCEEDCEEVEYVGHDLEGDDVYVCDGCLDRYEVVEETTEHGQVVRYVVPC